MWNFFFYKFMDEFIVQKGYKFSRETGESSCMNIPNIMMLL